jgi:predicted amidophosphoribosyltransferase
MWAQVQTAVSLIYPPRCLTCGDLVEAGGGLCGACWRETPFITGTTCASCGVPLPGADDGFRSACDDCIAVPRPWDAGRAALVYAGNARRLVLALKHGDRSDIIGPAAGWMARAGAPLLQGDPLIAPVPLHWTRLIRRRFNQSALLAQALGRRTGLEACPDLLIRQRRTPVLDGKSRAARFRTMADVIAPHPRRRGRIQGRAVLLVDDVMTSGATLAAAASACRKAGAAELRVLVLARVTKD